MSVRFKDLEFGKLFDGVQSILKFGDDYELSIVQHSSSYGGRNGLYEIAVFFQGEQHELAGVTQDGDTVKGYLSEQEVDGIILKMMALTGEDGVQV
jgi:hypothetical protein